MGSRLLVRLAINNPNLRIIIVGRRENQSKLVTLYNLIGPAQIIFRQIDLFNQAMLAEFLAEIRPNIIVQCASLLSPWKLSQQIDPISTAICRAGFGVQLCAQIPLISAVMRAVKASGYVGPIINCSYPDVTHTVLSRSKRLAPTLGAGNVGMIDLVVRAWHQKSGSHIDTLRVIAHHGHLKLLTGESIGSVPEPELYAGSQNVLIPLPQLNPPLPQSAVLNELSAAHAAQLIHSFLDQDAPAFANVPGPLGMQGGYPIRIHNGQIELDLNGTRSVSEAVTLNEKAAALDGIEAISADGTVIYTAAAQDSLPVHVREIAAPLEPGAELERLQLLTRHLH